MAKPTKFGKKWRARWIDENGKQVSGGVYETFREADAQIKLSEAKVEEINIGLRSPTPLDRPFDELCDYWLEKVTPQKRSTESELIDSMQLMIVEFIAMFGGLTNEVITPALVSELSKVKLEIKLKAVPHTNGEKS